ncbi:flavin reductase family protein [bacterium]|nr:flavin reductase family protein [bacterium]
MKIVTGRDIAALLNPRLAALVTCCEPDGTPNVLTVAWHTPLSHHPPLVGIGIAPTRFSHQLIADEGAFALNIVGQSLLTAVKICGTYSGRIDDKFAISDLETFPAENIRPPVLAGALGVMECKLVDEITTGDHAFFVGEVLLAKVRQECFSHAWKTDGADPVLQCLQKDDYGTFVEWEFNGAAIL